MEFPRKINEALQRERPFPLTYYASEAWRITFSNKGSFIGAIVTYFLLALVAAVAFSIVSAVIGFGARFDSSVGVSATMIIIQLIVMIAFGLLAFPIAGGFAQAAHTAVNQDSIPFNDFFAGYAKQKWPNLVITGLLVLVITYGAFFVVLLAVGSSFIFAFQEAVVLGPEALIEEWPSLLVGYLAIMSIAFVIRAMYSWSAQTSYFFDLRGWTALEASRRLLGWNFGWIILFDILLFLGVGLVIVAAGLLATLLGPLGAIIFVFLYIFMLLIIVPYYLNFQYVSFADTVRLNESDEAEGPDEDKIIDHFMPE
jgi:hypothetical protein